MLERHRSGRYPLPSAWRRDRNPGRQAVIEPGIKQLGAAAGMVDLFFEPLELDVLVDKVQRWARRKG